MTTKARAGWWVSFLAFGLLGTVWALTVPPLSGPDETAHIVKAAAVARGNLQTDVRWQENTTWGFRVPETSVSVAKGYDDGTLTGRSLCWSTISEEVAPFCLMDLPSDAGPTVDASTYVGTYQPAYYAAIGWPTRLLPPDRGVLVVRIVSALIAAALLASALTTAAAFGGAISVAATMLAIMLAFVYLMGVVNPSTIEIAASLLLWNTLLALFTDPRAPRRVVVRAMVAAVCLIAVRPLSPAIAVAIVASVVIGAADRDRLKELWARRSVRGAVLGSAIALVASAIHVVATNAYNSIIVSVAPEQRSTFTLARKAFGNTWMLPQEQVGLLGPLGFTSQRAPAALVDAWLALIVALVIAAMFVGTARRRAGLALILVGSLAAPVLAAPANPNAIWLGRYSLPLGIGVPLVAGWTIDRSGRVPPRVGAGVLAAVAVVIAGVYLIDYRGLVSRNLCEYPDALSAGLNDPLWDGPLTAGGARIAAFGASLAIAAAGMLWAFMLARGGPPDPTDPAATERRAHGSLTGNDGGSSRW